MATVDPTVTIYHNPRCGTSRNTLAMIRNAGIKPQVIDYLQTPLTRATLQALVASLGLPARELLRAKEPLCAELGLDNPEFQDAALIEAMATHPILMNRPVVLTPLGARLCRPSELVLDILPAAQQGSLAKEDGGVVVDEGRQGRHG